ncbi:Efflux transporter, outer membrane factor lipoprotein, NodT family [Paraburkholderia piptadeniae]|uniref:Efflux transporter, outer membrane factor lipoprotein, NodT family n=1 Tax=Paraburkholderia piptadeniae TaxID=1701573 RepID=A0A1N7RQ39_9BURK|nr:TolC family protein [Paraburkholderia piptadeniae]SIT37227.1 Efflux transporter, outer membrane factor lipoprotein, NodT family [Paraburkholderia piptadeniae]
MWPSIRRYGTVLLLRRDCFIVCLAGFLSGCMHVGPDFQPQHEAWSEHWSSASIEQVTQQAAQPDVRQWWQVFGDANLERLIAEADAGNGDLKIAGLRVLEARAQLGIALAGRYPQVQQASADVLASARKRSDGFNTRSGVYLQYGAGFTIGWELDFWGRFARAIESADAAFFAAQANRDAALVLLHAQVADTYFMLRTAEARLRIARENAQLQKRSYDIAQKLFKAGETDELDLQQARTQYLGTLSSIPDLESQIVLARHALSALMGRPPGPLPELDVQSGKAGVVPLVDRAVLQGVPADLLLRRPDVRAAEYQMAAQSALIGVAKADLYPSVSLLGSLVWSASSLTGSPNTLAFAAGPSVTWNVFDHGRITNNVRVQDARLQQLTVAYQNTVREAAREADDAATALTAALQRDSILNDAQGAARRSLTLANTVYREGYSDFQRVLDAQRALFAQQDAYIVNRSNAVGSLVALYKALGGGWATQQPLVDAATRQQMQQRTDWGDMLNETSAPSATAPSEGTSQ